MTYVRLSMFSGSAGALSVLASSFSLCAVAAEEAGSIFIDFQDLPAAYATPTYNQNGQVNGYNLHYCYSADPYAQSQGIGFSLTMGTICDVNFVIPDGGGPVFEPASVTGADGYGIFASGNVFMSFVTAKNPALQFVKEVTFTATSYYRNWTRLIQNPDGSYDYSQTHDYSYIHASAAGGNSVTIPVANRVLVTLKANPGEYIRGVSVGISPANPGQSNALGTLTMDNITVSIGSVGPDLAVGEIKLIQDGRLNPDTDGDSIIDLAAGVPTRALVTFSARNLGSNLSSNVPVSLVYQGQSFSQTVNLSSGTGVGEFVFIPAGSGVQPVSVSIQAAQGETLLANNAHTAQIQVRSKVSLVVNPLNGKKDEQGEPLAVEILPSVYACGRVSDKPSEARVGVKCVDESTGAEVAGCSFRVSLEEGPDNGGHSEPHATRSTLGRVLPESAFNWSVLQQAGSVVRFETPDVAGSIDFVVEGKSPSGNSLDPVRIRYRVMSPGYKPISVAGLTFDVRSHPEGNYGTHRMVKSLAKLVAEYYANAQVDGISNPPALRSEGASLPWGGLFDIDRDWVRPHCGHRDGMTLDLSLSVFNGYPNSISDLLKKHLVDAIEKSDFVFTFAPESPNPPKGHPVPSHWHIQLK